MYGVSGTCHQPPKAKDLKLTSVKRAFPAFVSLSLLKATNNKASIHLSSHIRTAHEAVFRLELSCLLP